MKKRGMFPINEMVLKFNKIVNFSCQEEILEFRKCYLIALAYIYDIP